MTEAEALDEAAKAAGWPNGWGEASRFAPNNLFNAIRAHAKTIMENAENARLLSMSAEREINLRGELLRLQRKNAALNAENERLRQAVQVRMDAKHREAAEAKLWFTKAQAWKAEIERLRDERRLAWNEAIELLRRADDQLTQLHGYCYLSSRSWPCVPADEIRATINAIRALTKDSTS